MPENELTAAINVGPKSESDQPAIRGLDPLAAYLLPAPEEEAPWRGGGLVSSQEIGLHDGGAKLPSPVLPRRVDLTGWEKGYSLFCGG